MNDHSLFYFEHRAEKSPYPPLLLIHGAGGIHLGWPPQVRRLKHVWVIAPDLPGHGQSDGEAHQAIGDYTADLLRLLDGLGIERVIVAGHSMGGAIAQQLALDAPGRVAGLVLVSTGARLPVTPVILENVIGSTGTVIDFVMTYAYGPTTGEDILRLGRQTLEACPPQTLYNDYLACSVFDSRDRLDSIQVPALIVGGGEDKMTPARFSVYLDEYLPRSSLHLIERAGHMIPVEYPDLLADIITEWLNEHFTAAR
ncbi:MAG: alpha/beta hydrolase [Anaerolineae bacterium]